MLSDRGVCVAFLKRNDRYFVLNFDNAGVAIEDELKGDFKTSGTFELQNLRTHRPITVSMAEWSCSKARALEKIRTLNSPARVTYAPGHP